MLAAKQMRALGRPEIASYLEMHALEETGHDRLIIKDLTALGLPAERLVAGLIPDGVKILVEIFDSYSSSDYPIGCIGYSYCFEYTAAMKPKSQVDAMQALCPPGIDASRFQEHIVVSEAKLDMWRTSSRLLPAFRRVIEIDIALAAYHTAKQTALLRREVRKSDEAIVAQISAVAGTEILLHA